ncbi:uncharacterized protein [Triticum aestivum]|uniref:uncharacterized protein isoform X3 n=1 Tax=Triticum aestivum TaxID=4565 RepID=UPI001D035709|nr:uncharacterized protein LOC123062565 isoform X3 [Triticum aestivum]
MSLYISENLIFPLRLFDLQRPGSICGGDYQDGATELLLPVACMGLLLVVVRHAAAAAGRWRQGGVELRHVPPTALGLHHQAHQPQESAEEQQQQQQHEHGRSWRHGRITGDSRAPPAGARGEAAVGAREETATGAQGEATAGAQGRVRE